MRAIPDHSNDQPTLPSPSVASPTLVLKESIPEELAALGREVLEMVPRKERGSLEAYRRAANELSRMLKVGGVRLKRISDPPKIVDRTEIVDPGPIVRVVFLAREYRTEFSDKLLAPRSTVEAD